MERMRRAIRGCLMGIWLPCLAGSTTTSQRNQHDSIHTSLDVSHDGRSPTSVYPGSGVRAPESNLNSHFAAFSRSTRFSQFGTAGISKF